MDPLPTKEEVEVVIRNLLPVPLNLYPASWQTAIPRMVEKELKFVRKMGSKNPVEDASQNLLRAWNTVSFWGWVSRGFTASPPTTLDRLLNL